MNGITHLFPRVLATQDNQLCEHSGEEPWARSAHLVFIPPKSTKGSAKWMLPGLLLPIFHWQLHLVLTVARMNSGADDLYGGLIGDEMGLGKVQPLILNVAWVANVVRS